jgi:hypothetical protein
MTLAMRAAFVVAMKPHKLCGCCTNRGLDGKDRLSRAPSPFDILGERSAGRLVNSSRQSAHDGFDDELGILGRHEKRTLNIADYSCGVASNQTPVEYPSWLAREERKSDRLAVAWSASICSSRGEEGGEVLDITPLGCRVRMNDAPPGGSHVGVVLPEFASVAGWVVWRSSGEVGIDFAHPLADVVFDEILRRNGALPNL